MTEIVGALDIGGTHVTAGRVEVDSATVDPDSRARIAFPPAGGPGVLERVVEAAAAVAIPEMRRFGVAVPGPFDYDAGISRISHKLSGLYGVDLRRELATAIGLSGGAISFLNDAEAFLLGEWWAGAARGHARVVGITLGTGLGSAFLEGGRIVRSGPRVPTGGELYRFAFRGHPVEETISRHALLEGYDAGTESGIDVEQIAARAQAGDSRAGQAFGKLASDLAEFLRPTLEAFTPTCLVVGGSIARAWEVFEPALREGLGRFGGLVVTRAADIDDAPLLGAAWHVAAQSMEPVVRESSHPEVEALRRRRLADGRRPVRDLSVTEAREAERAELERRAEPEAVAEVIDESLTGPAGPIPIRVYRPSSRRLRPALVYFFGGGWVTGSLDAADQVCRRLANSTPCAVVAVSYRLAPEHPFPAAVEDCDAATRWVAEHGVELGIDSQRVAVGGASAGGNLAAATAQLARDQGGPALRLQVLVYPLLDHGADTPSMRETVDPVFFDRDDVAWCWAHYLTRAADGNSPLASPLRAGDLRGLPPALVITAALDPLRDEGEQYAARLAAAGVPTELVRFDGMVHGFYSMNGVFGAADEAQAVTAAALRRALSA